MNLEISTGHAERRLNELNRARAESANQLVFQQMLDERLAILPEGTDRDDLMFAVGSLLKERVRLAKSLVDNEAIGIENRLAVRTAEQICFDLANI